MLNNASSQGINMALGQQKQFSWTQLAMAGATAWAGQNTDWVKSLQADRFSNAAFQTGSAMAGWGIDHAQGRDNGSGSSALISAISSAVASVVASSMQSVDNAKQQGVTATAQKAEVVDVSGAAPLQPGSESTGGFEIDGAAFAREFYAGKQVNIGPSAGDPTYTVQPGDTMSGIANRFSLDAGKLGALNGYGNDIRPGQVVHLSGTDDVSDQTAMAFKRRSAAQMDNRRAVIAQRAQEAQAATAGVAQDANDIRTSFSYRSQMSRALGDIADNTSQMQLSPVADSRSALVRGGSAFIGAVHDTLQLATDQAYLAASTLSGGLINDQGAGARNVERVNNFPRAMMSLSQSLGDGMYYAAHPLELSAEQIGSFTGSLATGYGVGKVASLFSEAGVVGNTFKATHNEVVLTTQQAADLNMFNQRSAASANGPVQFGQIGVSPEFSNAGRFKGASVSDVADAIRSGDISPSDIQINTIRWDGQSVAVNNRSLTALSEAGYAPRNVIDITDTIGTNLSNPDNVFAVMQRLREMNFQPSPQIGVRPHGSTWQTPPAYTVKITGE